MRSTRSRPVCGLLILALLLAACTGISGPDEAETSGRETVVVLHGLGRGASAMWLLAARIEDAGYRVVRIDYSSLTGETDDIVASVGRQIDSCCKTSPQQVHFVGFSLGGLMVRAYLADHRPDHRIKSLGRVVMIATPNHGTPLVDSFADTWWLGLAGPTAQSLGTGPDSFPMSLPAPDYPVGVIAGVSESSFTSERIPGDDDGVVSVESAKIEGMTDFITLRFSHFNLRYSGEVAEQTIAFLQRGHFLKEAEE
jgi:pimeloyl-ACP methyl ester carboxylesterase